MPLRLLAAALAAVVAVTLVLRLNGVEGCDDARFDVRAAAYRGEVDEAALDRVREHCRGTAGLAASAGVLLTAKRADRALELAREVVREEPDSALAWQTLAAVAAQTSPRDAERARRELRRLDPLGEEARRQRQTG